MPGGEEADKSLLMVQTVDYDKGARTSPQILSWSLQTRYRGTFQRAETKVEEIYWDTIKQTAVSARLAVKSHEIDVRCFPSLVRAWKRRMETNRLSKRWWAASAARAPALQQDDFTFWRKGSGTSACKSGESLEQNQGDMKQLFAIAVGLFLFATELSDEKVGKTLQHVENSGIHAQISWSTETRQSQGFCYHSLMHGGISSVCLQRSSLYISLIEQVR